jgi:hypothetical protein
MFFFTTEDTEFYGAFHPFLLRVSPCYPWLIVFSDSLKAM